MFSGLDFSAACTCVIVIEVEALVVFPEPAMSEEYLSGACTNPSFGFEMGADHLQRFALR
jgi:hypothetical protein